MLYSKLAFIAALAAPLVSAQDLSQLPQCAQTPAIAALGSTGCGLTDIACVCKNTAFLTSLIPAIKAACSASDFDKATQFAVQLCASAGVTITPPGAQSTVASTVPETTAALPVTTTPAAVTTVTTTAALTTTSVVVTTRAVTGTTTAVAVSVSSAPATTVSAAPRPSANATVTGATATPSTFKGAAAGLAAQMVGVALAVGAVGAVFAL